MNAPSKLPDFATPMPKPGREARARALAKRQLSAAWRDIDLDGDYLEAHPEMVISYVQVLARNFATLTLAARIEEIARELAFLRDALSAPPHADGGAATEVVNSGREA